ncbi:GNAT family N-acetyltransferase [Chitinophaga rhizosphaerae]|uniref:GNAT family N-acetyltransferase n=1 Tax=Chitinophaga rhizosphaerae TaxID=1864947 RepID=UPI0013DFC3DF|nr:GNAT family N-acetyltransferase [Chitinophaga rhizosphaerae]
MNAANDIRILSWHPDYQPHFERLNKAWISKFFRLEPVDIAVLEHPHEHIIAPGGDIIFVSIGNQVVGTVAYRLKSDDTVEMTKMAVDESFQGRKLGWALGKAIIERAAEKGFTKMVLYSSRRLTPAITMYHKLGFEEVEVENGVYERCDIKMEISLREPPLAALSRALQEEVLRTELRLLQFTDEEASARPSPEKWSKKEILGHLTDSALNNYPRFIRAQQTALLESPGYDPDFWVEARQYMREDWRELVQIWKSVNLHIVRLLPLIPAEALGNVLVIGQNPPATLEFWANDYLRHLQHHLHQIFPVHANY